jgi:hypothetical protein
MGLSFKITAGPRQSSHSQVRVPSDSWPHFTVSGPTGISHMVEWSLILRPTFRRPVSLGIKHPSKAYDRIFYSQTVAGFLIWGAFSDERMSLSFKIAAGLRQRSHSRVGVPWNSLLYFTVLDSKLYQKSKSKLCYDRLSVGQPGLVSSTLLGLTTRFVILSDSCGFVEVGRSPWQENGSAVYNCWWSSPAQSFLGPSPAGLVTTFCCLRFETPPTWRVKSPYLYLPGTG